VLYELPEAADLTLRAPRGSPAQHNLDLVDLPCVGPED
jgi:hypothetical protein